MRVRLDTNKHIVAVDHGIPKQKATADLTYNYVQARYTSGGLLSSTY